MTHTNPIVRAVSLLVKHGTPEQVDHALAVADHFDTQHRMVVALLHDTIEDGILEPHALVGAFSEGIVRDVLMLTRAKNQAYACYITRIREKGTDAAIAVKLADLKTNAARCHGDPERASLLARYQRAIAFLSYRTDAF